MIDPRRQELAVRAWQPASGAGRGTSDIGRARSRPGAILGRERSSGMRSDEQAGLFRAEAERHRPVHPREPRGTRMVAATIPRGRPLVGWRLVAPRLPGAGLVVAGERGQHTIIPREDTERGAGDHLPVLVQTDAIAALHERLATVPASPMGGPPPRRWSAMRHRAGVRAARDWRPW